MNQQEQMRELVRPYLEGAMRAEVSGLQEALADTGLSGRYLADMWRSL